MKEPNVVDTIVLRRRQLLEELGPELGAPVPAKRQAPLAPFMEAKGPIFEIKRSSPSQKHIAEIPDPAALAIKYAKEGALAISVLTETDWFHGSLKDLMAVKEALPNTAILRKDFLLSVEEVRVSYRAGADAVLLIASILTPSLLAEMALEAESLGMGVLLELRYSEDFEKLEYVKACLEAKGLPLPTVGINARDLRTFKIDLLVPLKRKLKIGDEFRLISESGIKNERTAYFASSVGFQGILCGGAVASDPSKISLIRNAFMREGNPRVGEFWKRLAELEERRAPIVKICGLTRASDALLVSNEGADLLGFIFSKKAGERKASAKAVREARKLVHDKLFIAVVTDTTNEEAMEALALYNEGYIDAFQFHNGVFPLKEPWASLPGYRVLSVGEEGFDKGELEGGDVRLLIDSKVSGKSGGTGKRVRGEEVALISERMPLYLAGGIGADNVEEIVRDFSPLLIDVSSALEARVGVKDEEKVKLFFNNLKRLKK